MHIKHLYIPWGSSFGLLPGTAQLLTAYCTNVLRFVGTTAAQALKHVGCLKQVKLLKGLLFVLFCVGTCSSAQAWAGQGPGRQQQGPLSSLLVHKPAGTASTQSYHLSESKGSRSPERISRSQPASPARGRRECLHMIQYCSATAMSLLSVWWYKQTLRIVR